MHEIIVCAAMRQPDGFVICGPRHFDLTMHGIINRLEIKPHPSSWEQGFIDQYGKFHTREEAANIVKGNSQWVRNPPKEELYSEDIY